jgi:Ca-activated chloride channel family protein
MNKTEFHRIIISALILLAWVSLDAQPAQKYIREGNSLFQDGKFKEAEIDYRKALEKSPKSTKAAYNLGNSQYKQQNYNEASASYQRLASEPSNKNLSQLYHNLGNSYLQAQKYNESIDAFKKALRLNPNDEDTRYNLAYAMAKLQQQKDKKQQEQKDKQQQQQQQNQQQQKNQQDQKQNQKMSKQDADRMLNALRNNEKRTMDKVKKQKANASSVQPEKDW